MQILPLLSKMELTGVVVVPSRLNEMQSKLSSKLTELVKTAQDLAGKPFNVASSEQVSEILYKTLNLPPPACTSSKGKHLSTSEEDLQNIKEQHPIVRIILEFRALSKMSSTYAEGLRPHILKEEDSKHADTGAHDAFEAMMRSSQVHRGEHRVFAQWHQTVGNYFLHVSIFCIFHKMIFSFTFHMYFKLFFYYFSL